MITCSNDEERGHRRLGMPSIASEREDRSVLPCPKRIYERLAHEESDRDTDCNSDHGAANVDTAAGRSKTTGLGKPGLRSQLS
jgi:hypothetical protein